MPLLSSVLSRDIHTTDRDSVVPDCYTGGDTPGTLIAHQLVAMRAAAANLTAIVDAIEKCGSSLSKSTSQVTGPSCPADQIEQHMEASLCFNDQLTIH